MYKISKLIKEKNQFDETEFTNFSHFLYDFFLIKKGLEKESVNTKVEILNKFLSLLNDLLYSYSFEQKKGKLELINLINKLNTQKEIFEFLQSKSNINDIKIAGKHLGKKSQTVFSSR